MKNILLALIIILLIAGCIRGNVRVEKNETAALVNETRVNETNAPLENSTGPADKPDTPVVEAITLPQRYFPWDNLFKDLDEFAVTYYYVKSSSFDTLYQEGKLKEPQTAIIKIWFKGNMARIDRYESEYIGKETCDTKPMEFLDHEGKQYALVARELYRGKKLDGWRYGVISKGVTSGGTDVWKCDTKKSSSLQGESVVSPIRAMLLAYDNYASRYGTPHFYENEDAYQNEAQLAQRAYENYSRVDGVRYVRETNSLKQAETVAGRKAVPFYVTKQFAGEAYGRELRDKELGLGLAFYLKQYVDTRGQRISLRDEMLVYTMLEFDPYVEDAEFEE